MSEVFKTLCEDLEQSCEGWQEWVDMPMPEEDETLPGDWHKKTTPFQRMLLVRAKHFAHAL